MAIKSFEDLKVWQDSRQLSNIIYEITSKYPKEEKFNLIDQSRRSVVSVSANIAEGFSRFHAKESVLFYRNARGSLSELKSHLYLAYDRKYIDKLMADQCFEKIDEIGKMINGLINKTKDFRH